MNECREMMMCKEDLSNHPDILNLLCVATRKLLIICDGSTDETFLEKVFTLAGNIDISNISFCVAQSVNNWSIRILKKNANCKVLIVHDLEFSLVDAATMRKKETERLSLTEKEVYYLELPCIESFLVAHYILEVDHQPFDYLRSMDETLRIEFSNHYLSGLMDSKRKLGRNAPPMQLDTWVKAQSILNGDWPPKDREDVFTLVQVLRGHTLVSKANAMTNRTMERKLTKAILTYPGIEALCDLVANLLT